jgi:hypothetical protein
MFSIERLNELKAYANALDDDSVAPKQKILEIIENMEEEQQRIAMIEAEAQMMQQRAEQFIMGDPDSQAQQIADAQAQLEMAEQEVIDAEEELPTDEEIEE